MMSRLTANPTPVQKRSKTFENDPKMLENIWKRPKRQKHTKFVPAATAAAPPDKAAAAANPQFSGDSNTETALLHL